MKYINAHAVSSGGGNEIMLTFATEYTNPFTTEAHSTVAGSFVLTGRMADELADGIHKARTDAKARRLERALKESLGAKVR